MLAASRDKRKLEQEISYDAEPHSFLIDHEDPKLTGFGRKRQTSKSIRLFKLGPGIPVSSSLWCRRGQAKRELRAKSSIYEGWLALCRGSFRQEARHHPEIWILPTGRLRIFDTHPQGALDFA